MYTELLIPGKYYHIYNRGINGEDLFKDDKNYPYFLQLYEKHISPVAETYAWCLLKNHFHLLVQIREHAHDTGKNYNGETGSHQNPSKAFSNLFNAYAKAINKAYNRTGGLFETPFRRIRIDNEGYFRYMVYYIHHNPVKHGFCESLVEYPWSSYLSVITVGTGNKKVVGWFNGLNEFIRFHQQPGDMAPIRPFIIEK